MYPVSEAFLRAVQENTRRYYWTGKITTKGGAVIPVCISECRKRSSQKACLRIKPFKCNPKSGGGSACAGR